VVIGALLANRYLRRRGRYAARAIQPRALAPGGEFQTPPLGVSMSSHVESSRRGSPGAIGKEGVLSRLVGGWKSHVIM
jgi:hypothetical protein